MSSTDPPRKNYWIDLEIPDLHDSGRSQAELRRFGLVMAGAIALLGGYFHWRGHAVAPWVAGLGGVFLLTALAVPRSLGPVERFWLAIGKALGAVVTRTILTLAFFLVITPLGLAMRVFAGETLGKRPDATMKTYWVHVEPDGPASRPDKPF
ncbi:MAG TPA: SxtJ family membrane protein [Longimicrobiales bacterium]|nr:SxtJ family membrane protein [Longimicrobiales bacterium]